MVKNEDATAEIKKLASEIEQFIVENDALLHFREKVVEWRRQKEELWGGPRPKKTIIPGLNNRPIELDPSTDDKDFGDVLEALRLKNNQEVPLLSKYACLSVVHDYHLGGVECIRPPEWWVSDKVIPIAMAYSVLGLSPVLLDHISNLRAWWAVVKADALKAIQAGGAQSDKQDTPAPGEDMMTVGEIADLCGVTSSRISQLCNGGTITSEGVRKKRRVSLVSAKMYFVENEKRKHEAENRKLAGDARKDAADIEQDNP